MGSSYERITSRLLTVDPWGDYEELEAGLSLGVPASQAGYGLIVDALEKAEKMARKAHGLFSHAKVQHESFEVDAGIIESGMRDRALAALTEAKKSGEFTKAINGPDIEAYMRTHFTDEYRDLAVRREKAKRMVDSLEDLVQRWRDRRRTLETLAQGAR